MSDFNNKATAPLLAPLAALAFCVFAPTALASFFVSPHGSGRDGEMAGNTVASPNDGSSAMQVNPAGVVSETRDQAFVGVIAFPYVTHYKNDATGYDGTSSKTPFNFGAWYGLGEVGGWSMGVGGYGALGTAYDMPADPDIGQTMPYTGELVIINFGLNIGREVLPGLRIGAQITPAYGRQRLRTPTPLGGVDVDADGFGISSMVGAVYTPADKWSLGLSYRTRGFIDLEGDGSVGAVEQDYSVDFVTPQMLLGGVAFKWSERLNLMGQLSYMRFKDFESGEVEFEKSTALNQPVMSDTNNRVRWGVGLEYITVPNSVFRIGYTESKASLSDAGMRPMMFDNDNRMLMAGYEIDHGTLMVGFNAGLTSLKTRNISAQENPAFPGRYGGDAKISVGLRFTWKLQSRRAAAAAK